MLKKSFKFKSLTANHTMDKRDMPTYLCRVGKNLTAAALLTAYRPMPHRPVRIHHGARFAKHADLFQISHLLQRRQWIFVLYSLFDF
jgi:hypothetical protein